MIPKGKRNADLTDMRVNMLTVLYRVDDKILPCGQIVKRWMCRCECGNEAVIYESSLRSNRVKSCGCMKYAGLQELDDLEGQVINGIKILSRAEDEVQRKGNHIPRWLCQCHCGKLFVTRGSAIKSGHTKSCGCRKKQLRIKEDDMVDRIFNKLRVESRGEDEITSNGLRFIRWNCVCECGNHVLVRGTSLRDGHAISCGCERDRVFHTGSSKGEQWIAEWLDEHGYMYERQKFYDDLVSSFDNPLFYDFLVHLNTGDVLLECQGLQHYEPVDLFGGEQGFRRQVENDDLKREYARFCGIPLFEIDYRVTEKRVVVKQLSNIINKCLQS